MHSAYLTVCARGALLIGAVLVALAAGTAPVHAWTVEGLESGGVLLSREASDTGTAVFYMYRRSGTPTANQYANGSFDNTDSAGFFNASAVVQTITVDANTQSISYRAAAGQAILVEGSTARAFFFAPDYYSKPVYLTSGGAVYSAFATSTPVTVLNSAGSTVSVAGTLPVDVSAIGGSADLPAALVAVAGLCLGLTLWGRLTWK